MKRISYATFLKVAYPLEGWIFWRRVDGNANDSDIELYQARPNRHIRQLINSL